MFIKDIYDYSHINNASYDSLSKVIYNRGNYSNTNNIVYDNKKNVSSYNDGVGITYSFIYDAINRLTSIRYNNNKLILLSYNSNGDISSYHYSDELKEIINVYNYSVNDLNIPYGAITSIKLNSTSKIETLYSLTYQDKRLKQVVNNKTGIREIYNYNYDKIDNIVNISDGIQFIKGYKYNHFDILDEVYYRVNNNKYYNKVSDSSNHINRSIVGLDYMLMAKNDTNLYWTFFASRKTTINNEIKDISNYLVNRDTLISTETNVNVNYSSFGLEYMNVSYSSKGIMYNIDNIKSILIDIIIEEGNGTLFEVKNDKNKIAILKNNNKVIIKINQEEKEVTSSNILGHHIIIVSIDETLSKIKVYIDNLGYEIEYKATNDNNIQNNNYNKLVLNGLNTTTINKYGAIIIKSQNILKEEERRYYRERIKEVYESKDKEITPSNISYNEEVYKYDEIVFNNTFESRNLVKPIKQKNNDLFYSIRENFEYLPSLRGESIGDNVYVIKNQELVYDFNQNTSGTVAIRCKTILNKEVTLLELDNKDIDIIVKKTASNLLNVIINKKTMLQKMIRQRV